ncbi:hypothetical protein BTHE68_53540 [Burkholderia sp. THE68]|uniref:glucosamine inositolphosphorylceramide transferase family protein n=1 Tax=Burkholderia sp. THE68 TaxID=758782 RepID=UPI00131836B8|nr:hypothetical protein [Burkholderia sp. THE68]BBU31620.1 hypothetical protein BTHE68_53540 [Burkholderia sp. THE68]
MAQPAYPPVLQWWTRIEKRLYDEVDDASRDSTPARASLVVLYDGHENIEALWKTLLQCRTPHLQIVWKSPESGEMRLLAESYVAIPEKLFFLKSLQTSLQRVSVLIERAQRRLDAAASPYAFPLVSAKAQPAHLSGLTSAWFALRHLGRKVLNQPLKLLVQRGHWVLAYRRTDTPVEMRADSSADNSADDDASRNWVTLPGMPTQFHADPFLWRGKNGDYHLFFESLPYDTNRGVISHIAFDPATQKWQETPRVVLDRNYHLSYPFLFEHDGEIFMIPETCGNRTIEMYRAASFPTEWELHKVVMRDVVAADTTLHYDGKTWWMFTSITEEGGSNWDELSIFHSDSPFGEWTAHPMNPVVSDCRLARMAGNLFKDAQNRLIRPAQNCEREYGAALTFREITELTTTTYAEKTLSVRNPPRGRQGLHTWNAVGAITVIDMKTQLRKWNPWRGAMRRA